jgi:hypothetical protein
MTMLRSGVLGVLAGTATFVALQHADRLRESLATDEVVERFAEALRPHLPAAAEPHQAAPPALAEPAAESPHLSSVPAAAATLAAAAPMPETAAERERPGTPAAGAARATETADPSLREAGRRAADLAEAMDRLSRRLGRSTPGGGR